jgi:adenylosuccinate lyase
MIPRYSRLAMLTLWSDEAKLQYWWQVELAVLEVLAKRGEVPQEDLAQIKASATINPARMAEIEAAVHHDVIAFVTMMAESVDGHASGEGAGRWIHYGLTSSDVVDTAFGLQLCAASDLLQTGLQRLADALKTQALAHRHTPCVGRTHGMHAEPITFGLKLAGFYAEVQRNLQRLLAAREEVAICKLSGAVGAYTQLPPAVEAAVASRLNLRPETAATQVVPRDRHAMWFSTLAVIAGGLERLATEIRHLQRSEVAEVEEYFDVAQKGSSAMPHKRNPILSENVVGLCRYVRSAALPALENIALWHERDISHSAVERVIAPDASIALDFSLHRLAGVIEKLQIYPDQMLANLQRTNGLVFSQSLLLRLVESGLDRDTAYRAVQSSARMVAAAKDGSDLLGCLRQHLAASPTLANHAAALPERLDLGYYYQQLDVVFAKVFGS